MRRNQSGTGQIRVPLDGLPAALTQILSEFNIATREASIEAVVEVTKESAKIARKEGTYQNRRPKYRKSISSRIESGVFGAEGQVYASGHEYSLTHLLEHGHLLWQSPLHPGTRPFPHWIKAADYAHKELPVRVAEKIMKRR